jgi:hypothetical protein
MHLQLHLCRVMHWAALLGSQSAARAQLVVTACQATPRPQDNVISEGKEPSTSLEAALRAVEAVERSRLDKRERQ